MKFVDLVLFIDGLRLNDDESIDDFVKKIAKNVDSAYPIRVDVQWEEKV